MSEGFEQYKMLGSFGMVWMVLELEFYIYNMGILELLELLV